MCLVLICIMFVTPTVAGGLSVWYAHNSEAVQSVVLRAPILAGMGERGHQDIWPCGKSAIEWQCKVLDGQ